MSALVPPAVVDVVADDGVREVPFSLAAGGTVAVLLDAPDGAAVRWHPDYRAVVRCGGGGVVDHGEQLWQPRRDRAYLHVAAGECELVIADEPTTALDVTVQAQIVALMVQLRDELGMALVWISHDLGVVAGLADRVAIVAGHRQGLRRSVPTRGGSSA